MDARAIDKNLIFARDNVSRVCDDEREFETWVWMTLFQVEKIVMYGHIDMCHSTILSRCILIGFLKEYKSVETKDFMEIRAL